jgi:uncharacterized protein (TIGR02265 family)
MASKQPTIKGIFVNSHINAVKKAKGAEGVRALEKKYGKPLHFKNNQDVLIREEVKLIEAALEVLSSSPIPSSHLSFEAGKLHFRNFSTTPLARIIFSVFRKKFKLMMMQSENIAGHVFRGVRFSSENLGPKEVKVTMENNDYPIDHFKGLFQEWMIYSGCHGTVEAEETSPNRYEYVMRWR